MTQSSDVPRRRLGRPSTLDREGALLAARAVIAERGIDRTRYSDVGEAAGVPVTTLQHAFGSLQAMLLESVRTGAEGEIAVLRALSHDARLTPWERVQQFVAGAVEPPSDPHSWPVWLEFWRVASRDAAFGSHAGELYEQWWSYLAELVTLGRDDGSFGSALAQRPHDAAMTVIGVVDGIGAALVLRADGPDYVRTRQLALAATAELLGVAPRPASP